MLVTFGPGFRRLGAGGASATAKESITTVPRRQSAMERTASRIKSSFRFLTFSGTAQRPALVHITARANAERIRWYRITEQNDLDAARDYMPLTLVRSSVMKAWSARLKCLGTPSRLSPNSPLQIDRAM